jgi:hypothetical protein
LYVVETSQNLASDFKFYIIQGFNIFIESIDFNHKSHVFQLMNSFGQNFASSDQKKFTNDSHSNAFVIHLLIKFFDLHIMIANCLKCPKY